MHLLVIQTINTTIRHCVVTAHIENSTVGLSLVGNHNDHSVDSVLKALTCPDHGPWFIFLFGELRAS